MQKERGPGKLPMSAEQARRQSAVDVAKPTQSGITRKSDLRRIHWPRGSRFAFTVFDDPDAQSFATTRLVYSFLADLGFRTTIGVWPLDIRRKPNSDGGTCGNAGTVPSCSICKASDVKSDFIMQRRTPLHAKKRWRVCASFRRILESLQQ